jgi:cbb3-type cytochrome oxidase subunit 3
MRRFRFDIGTLVILVLVLGVSFAALRESNDIWDSSIFTLTLGVMLISILLAVHRTEKRRAFWLGFALFGAAYLGLSLVPSIEPRLITTTALTYIDSMVPRSSRSRILRVRRRRNDGPLCRQPATGRSVPQQRQRCLPRGDSDRWIEPGEQTSDRQWQAFSEHLGGSVAEGIGWHDREFHADWAFALCPDLSILGRSAFTIPPFR